METEEILARIIVGALAGTAAASLMGMRGKARGGFTYWVRNTVIGIVGGLVGAFLLDLLDADLPDILNGAITLADLLVAFLGAILVILVVGFIQRR